MAFRPQPSGTQPIGISEANGGIQHGPSPDHTRRRPSRRGSPKTVSRVINGAPRVSDGTAARVHKAIEDLDFHLNDVARSLRPGQRSHLLGLVIGDLANPFDAILAAGVEEVARKNHNLVLMSSSEGDAAREQELVIALRRRQVDGIMMVPTGTNQDYLETGAKGRNPLRIH